MYLVQCIYNKPNAAIKQHQQYQNSKIEKQQCAALLYQTLYKMHSAGFSPVCTLKCLATPNGVSSKFYTNDTRWLLAVVHQRMPDKNIYHPRDEAANSSKAYTIQSTQINRIIDCLHLKYNSNSPIDHYGLLQQQQYK